MRHSLDGLHSVFPVAQQTDKEHEVKSPPEISHVVHGTNSKVDRLITQFLTQLGLVDVSRLEIDTDDFGCAMVGGLVTRLASVASDIKHGKPCHIGWNGCVDVTPTPLWTIEALSLDSARFG